MQSLPLLIRLARQRADARRVALAEAGRRRLAAAESLATEAQAEAAESERLSGDAEGMAWWPAWSRAAAGRRRRLAAHLSTLAVEEDGIRAALAEDFAEMKRLEIAWEARQRAAAQAAARKAERAAEEAALLRAR